MLKYIIKRILILIPVVFVISVVIFGLSEISPGNPVEIKLAQNPGLKPEARERIEKVLTKKYGLDKPVPERYVIWMKNNLSGDFGETINGQDVKKVLAEPLRNTVILNIFVLILSLVVSIIAGIKSAVRKDKFYDKFWQVFSIIGMSMPTFFMGLILIFIFALNLKWLPSGGMPSIQLSGGELAFAWVKHLILPVIVLSIGSLAGTVRYVRNAMVEALNQDYIRTARSKGLSEKVVIYSHAFRNALIPVTTIVIGSIGSLFAGSAITESVFNYNGLGSKLIASINNRDWAIAIAINLFTAIIYVITNFVADITYALVDPRIRLD